MTPASSERAMRADELSRLIIGCCIEIHRELGAGLLESAYEQCVCYELSTKGVACRRQVKLPLEYKGVKIDCGYVIDLMVEDLIVLELKSIEQTLPIHQAQLLTYLRLTGCSLGMLINFNVPVLKYGIKRMVLNHH